jgi:hypothetical protein
LLVHRANMHPNFGADLINNFKILAIFRKHAVHFIVKGLLVSNIYLKFKVSDLRREEIVFMNYICKFEYH